MRLLFGNNNSRYLLLACQVKWKNTMILLLGNNNSRYLLLACKVKWKNPMILLFGILALVATMFHQCHGKGHLCFRGIDLISSLSVVFLDEFDTTTKQVGLSIRREVPSFELDSKNANEDEEHYHKNIKTKSRIKRENIHLLEHIS